MNPPIEQVIMMLVIIIVFLVAIGFTIWYGDKEYNKEKDCNHKWVEETSSFFLGTAVCPKCFAHGPLSLAEKKDDD